MKSQKDLIQKNESEGEETEEFHKNLCETNYTELAKESINCDKKLSQTSDDDFTYLRKLSKIKILNDSRLNISKNSEISFKLIFGELINNKFPAFFIYQKNKYHEGNVYVTNFRITFIANNIEFYEKEFINVEYLNCLYTRILE